MCEPPTAAEAIMMPGPIARSRCRQREVSFRVCSFMLNLRVGWNIRKASRERRLPVNLSYFASLNPRFKCTINSATAAGVTPEMRLAWPTVSGRCWLSFCCTSADKPLTLL